MGESVEVVREPYIQAATDTLVDAFNEGYRLGLRAAKQIYK